MASTLPSEETAAGMEGSPRSTRRGFVDLVVDVGDVVDEYRLVAALAQPRTKPHSDHDRTSVADVCARIDRWPADIHAHVGRIDRHEVFLLAGQRIVEAQCHGFSSLFAHSPCKQGDAPS